MKLLIEISDGLVQNVWCSEPEQVEVIVRDLDILNENTDPLNTPGVAELRVPHFIVY